MTAQDPIVITGTGLSGFSLAREFRKLDKDVRLLMITADDGWEIERDGKNVRAVFKDPSGQVLGFAVTGSFAVEKQALAKSILPIHG